MDHEELLSRAVALAAEAKSEGNHPFGALLADAQGQRAVDRAQHRGHRIRRHRTRGDQPGADCASQTYGRFELAPLTLYSSAEPCAMCAGAIYWSGIGRVVFALAEEELLGFTGDDPENPTLSLSCRDVLAAGQRPVEVIGPVDLAAARDVHRGFWRS